ncbi:MAG: phage tail tip lysozyme, partial [Candidatus Thorarchaeota archaeon]
AVVLTNPIPTDPKQINLFTGDQPDGSEKISQFTYRARIVGVNSPHDFLPDPCDSTYTDDPVQAEKLIAMHTLFVSKEEDGVGNSLPRKGSTVEVKLTKNVFSYNLQIGEHLKVVSNPQQPSANNVECDSLQGIMNNAGSATSLANIPIPTQRVASNGAEFMEKLRNSGHYPVEQFSDAYLAGVAANASAESNFNASAAGDALSYFENNPDRFSQATIQRIRQQAINGKCSFGLFQFNVCGGAGGDLLSKNGFPDNSSGNYLTEQQKSNALTQVLTSMDKQIKYVSDYSKTNSVLKTITQTNDPNIAGQYIAHYFERCSHCGKTNDHPFPEGTGVDSENSTQTASRGVAAEAFLAEYIRIASTPLADDLTQVAPLE